MSSPTSSLSSSLCGILVGDELGQVKHIDLLTSNSITTINSDIINSEPSPSKSVTCISPFAHEVNNTLYLITNKPNTISLYNCLTGHIKQLKSPSAAPDLTIVGAETIGRSNIVVCYDNGSIFVQNIEKDVLESSDSHKKAIKMLGLDLTSELREEVKSASTCVTKESKSSKDGEKPLAKPRAKPSQQANQPPKPSAGKPSTSTSLFAPNWNTTANSLTCFKTSNHRLAIAGRNVDLKVFDLNTQQCVFTAKSTSRDWLGLKHQVWVSDLDWVGGNSVTNKPQSMVATCSRSDACIRIYDMNSKQRKPAMNFNLKDQTFNNDSNPPAFSAVCATAPPHSVAVPTQNLILGTTMGRMLALDVRFNSHSYRHLGTFKGFGGGAIRDIKHVGLAVNSCKILSCSLDRFVRVHSMTTATTTSRHLEAKFYVKTRPTCLQPISGAFGLGMAPIAANIDDDDEELESD